MVTKFYLFFLSLFLGLASFSFSTPVKEGETYKIKAIVFDFSGVIAKEDKEEVADFIAKSFGISQAEGMRVQDEYRAHLREGGDERSFWIAYAQSIDKTLPDNWLEELMQVKFKALKEIPGMVNLVRDLQKHGYQTALLSNVSQGQARVKRQLGYYELFHPILLSHEVGLRKPDPKIYQLLLDRLHLPPENVLFVDNKQVNIDVAKSLGIDGVTFVNANQLMQELKLRGIELKQVQGCN